MGTRLVAGELLPELDELQQRDDTHVVAIPVDLDGPARSQIMPALPGVCSLMFPDTIQEQPLVNEDPTRARLVIWCTAAAVFVGWDAQAVKDGKCPKLAAGAAPLEFRHTGRMWVRSDVTVATVSFFTENWTR